MRGGQIHGAMLRRDRLALGPHSFFDNSRLILKELSPGHNSLVMTELFRGYGVRATKDPAALT